MSDMQANMMSCAIDAYRSGKMTRNEAARVFGIPRSTLSHHLQGKPYRPRGGTRKFTTSEEEDLLELLLRFESFGMILNRRFIRQFLRTAGIIKGLKNVQFLNPWMTAFGDRHPELGQALKLYGRSANLRMKIGHFRNWNSDLSRLKREGYFDSPRNIWNLGCFEIGGFAEEKVSIVTAGNWNGTMLQPLIFFDGKLYLEPKYQQVIDKCYGGVNDSGMFDEKIWSEYIQCQLLPVIGGSKTLICFDPTSSLIPHNVLLEIFMRDENRGKNIELIFFPPGKRNLVQMQPLRDGVAEWVKQEWDQRQREKISKLEMADRMDFVGEILRFWSSVDFAPLLQTGFTKADLIPTWDDMLPSESDSDEVNSVDEAEGVETGRNKRDLERAKEAERIKRGLELRATGKMTMVEVGRTFGISKHKLRNRLRGLTSKIGCPFRFTSEEENVFIEILIDCERYGIPLSRVTLREVVKAAGKVKGLANENPSRQWFKTFRDRHPELVLRKTKHRTSRQSQKDLRDLNRKLIGDWNENLNQMKERGYLENGDMIWDIEECELTGSGDEQMSVVMCGNGNGRILQYLLMVNGEFWSDDGLSSEQIWTDLIENHLLPTISSKAVVCFDGNHPNMSNTMLFEIVLRAKKHGKDVQLFCFPTGNTSQPQPLKHSVFESLKKKWDNQRRYSLTGNGFDFATRFAQIWNTMDFASLLINGFRAANLNASPTWHSEEIPVSLNDNPEPQSISLFVGRQSVSNVVSAGRKRDQPATSEKVALLKVSPAKRSKRKVVRNEEAIPEVGLRKRKYDKATFSDDQGTIPVEIPVPRKYNEEMATIRDALRKMCVPEHEIEARLATLVGGSR